jgi:Fe-Mn family superoxide dismutase
MKGLGTKMIELMKLPYERDALAPVITKEMIDFHYGKHHQGYVDNLNKLIKGTAYEDMSLEDIIREAASQQEYFGDGRPNPLFNNAAQVYNHNLYWESLRPEEPVGSGMSTKAEDRINRYYGSVDGLKETIKKSASRHFGSGWVWICEHEDESLFVQDTHDAGTPIVDPLVKPLLVIDVWEHAYYLEYKNDRAAYVDAIWPILNWDNLA